MSRTWMSHVTHINESYHTYEWVMSHIWTSPITHMNEWCHTHEWVMSHTWTSHVTHMNGSCHTQEWVMSHIWPLSPHLRCEYFTLMSPCPPPPQKNMHSMVHIYDMCACVYMCLSYVWTLSLHLICENFTLISYARNKKKSATHKWVEWLPYQMILVKWFWVKWLSLNDSDVSHTNDEFDSNLTPFGRPTNQVKFVTWFMKLDTHMNELCHKFDLFRETQTLSQNSRRWITLMFHAQREKEKEKEKDTLPHESHVTHMNESCLTYEGVVLHM